MSLDTPIVGAICWDAWFTGSPGTSDETALTPVQWNDRWPFYTNTTTNPIQIRLDSQELIDQEIVYAAGGGLDFWAFDYYGESHAITHALHKYQASPNKHMLKYCFVIVGQAIVAPDYPTSIVQHFQDPQYVKVLGNRPLVYLFESSTTKANVDTLKNAAAAAGETVTLGGLVLTNIGANPVKLGGSAITFSGSGGYSLAAGASMSLDLARGDDLYAICNTGLTSTLDILYAKTQAYYE